MYFKYRDSVLKTSLPFYIAQLVFYYMSILIPEGDVNKGEVKVWYNYIPLAVDYLNILSAFYTGVLIFQNTRHQGKIILESVWVYFDLTYFVVLIIISVSRIAD